MKQHTWRVGEKIAGKRLDQCVLAELEFRYSRTQIQRWLAAGVVRLNGAVVPAHRRVKAGETVVVDLAAAEATRPVRTLMPEPLPLDIVCEDADILVVNKPAGLVTHPAPGNWSGTLMNAVLWHLQQQRSSVVQRPAAAHGVSSGVRRQTQDVTPFDAARRRTQDDTLRPGLIHRLDKDTSGLLLIAKTERAHAALAKQLKALTIQRTYVACVEGSVEFDEGTVDAPLGRHLSDRKRMSVRYLGGRSAVTHYRVLRRVAASSLGPYTVVECRLETGRTHQIRVHMAHLGHPVLGDATYGTTTRGKLPRHYLHAIRLSFQHPITGERVEFHAPAPDDMARFVEERSHG